MKHWHIARNGAEVIHTRTYAGFTMEVSNWPGSRTLRWRVKSPDYDGQWHDEDRCEHGVGSLKERCFDVVENIMASRLAAKN